MKILITRQILNKGINLFKEKEYKVTISPHNRILSTFKFIN